MIKRWFLISLLTLFPTLPPLVAAQFGIGLTVPMIQDKVYVAPQFDIASEWFGFYFDMGLMYTRRDIQGFEDKHWLGYYLNSELFFRFSPRPDFCVKTGTGYAFDHVVHIDNSLKYHQMPLFITAEYRLPAGLKLFYRLKYPIFKSEDLDMKLVNTIGIGWVFQ
ncbi:MAG: hypothetical protein KBA26_11005 [Candidatus Delongbacteria bacterium]|nr:hypothetical protein [Candidatus Delongbacteria bacterium]